MQPCIARVPFLLLLLAPCASFGADAVTLKRRAKQAYERAIATDSEDRRSRDGLARLDGSR